MSFAFRAAALAGFAILAGCQSSTPPADLSANPVPSAAEGRIPEYCPRVSLREGTAVLTKKAGEDVVYVASITDSSRECHVVNGQLMMKVGIAGRVMPGPAAKSGTIQLPIRVALVSGSDVLYSQLSQQSVSVSAGGGAVQFVYVDDRVVVPEPPARTYAVYAGFDEGPAPKAKR
ncbi:hypothetical protein [Consotaella salsifontis]|nr:hypothetical protein [Consotaella salsifontis]